LTLGARLEMASVRVAARRFATPAVQWIALLALCSAYIQGGLTKLFSFDGAIAEMSNFGLTPPVPFAIATIVLELAAPLAILSGRYRWLGALVLAGFTLMATFVANRFWELPPPQRRMTANAFFEHLGLAGAFLLVARHDARGRGHPITY
jgi:uncharacterized membrane protein YphA (DoxX/SURF4 family)